MREPPPPESDPRFPSGKWNGYYLKDPQSPGRHLMELDLAFTEGQLTGLGRDRVGEFRFQGRYDLSEGTCYWTKHYLGAHDVFYRGFNEGKGIWGLWELSDHAAMSGGFHIWPSGMSDPSAMTREEELDLPRFHFEPEEQPAVA